jgi:hypothetical protein
MASSSVSRTPSGISSHRGWKRGAARTGGTNAFLRTFGTGWNRKKTDAEKNRWHQAEYQRNIDLRLFGDLASIVISYWQEFDDLFPSQHWIKQRLDDPERSKNVIAHANLLPDTEIERIERYLED